MFSTPLRVGVGAALVVLGLSVMSGWIFDVGILKSVLPGWPNMKFNPALCFVLLGLAFILTQRPGASARIGAVICGVAVATIAGLTVAEYLTGRDFGIDQLVVADQATYSGSGLPGRMSPLSASAFVFEGIAVILLNVARRGAFVRLAHAMGVGAGVTIFFTAAGYAFGANALGQMGLYKLMAVHTAIAHTAACIAIVATRAPESWLAGYEQAPVARAALLRFLPVSIGLPTAIGLLLLLGANLGLYGAEFALSLFGPFMTLVAITIGLRVAQYIRDGEVALRVSQAQLEESRSELARVSRLTTLGEMSAAIAHEINQFLTAIRANAGAASNWLRKPQPELDEAQAAMAAIDRNVLQAGKVIGRIHEMARRAPPRIESVEINAAIGQIIELVLGEAARAKVRIETQLVEDSPLVSGDQIQLQQVMLNLIINAIESMREVAEQERNLTISTRSLAPDEVLVAVRDTGPGLDAPKLDRVFEAFYTTKPGGLGIGLSICRSIVEAHGGRLWAEANSPRGAVFQFTLRRLKNDGRATLAPNESDKTPDLPALRLERSRSERGDPG